MQKEEGRRQNEEGRSQRSEIRGQKSEAGDKQQATRPPAAVLLRRTGNLAQSQIANRKSQILVPLLAATGPITCIGLGLMLYNTLRFDNPLEFGTHYQLSDLRMTNRCIFGVRITLDSTLGFISWGRRAGVLSFPFVHDIKLPPLPAGHGINEHPFGVLTNIPLVWLAVAAPLAWRGRSADVRGILRGFLAAVALLFATRALTLGFFRSAHARYEWSSVPRWFCWPSLASWAWSAHWPAGRLGDGRPDGLGACSWPSRWPSTSWRALSIMRNITRNSAACCSSAGRSTRP